MRKASRATVINQTKKATWIQIASELKLDTQGTKAELVSRIGDALTVIPAHVSDESRAVLHRLGYEDAPMKAGDEEAMESNQTDSGNQVPSGQTNVQIAKELQEYRENNYRDVNQPRGNNAGAECDLLEIRPMRIVGNDNQKELVEPCDKKHAEFYALYLKLPDGTQDWIEDHDTFEDATDHFQKLRKSGQLDETLSALKVAKKILSDGKKSPVPATQVRSIGNAAMYLQHFKLHQKALRLHLKAAERIEEVSSDPRWQATQLWCLGTTCKVLDKQGMATQYIAEAIDRGSIVAGDGKLVIWQHILDVWEYELRTLYREQIKQRIMECVKKYTICSVNNLYKYIKWAEKKEIDCYFASLLIDKRIKEKTVPSGIFSKPPIIYQPATIEA